MAIIDAAAPDVGGGANRVDGYQYGIVVDAAGERFLDEGADARAHTYARYGREIFERPGGHAYVVLDSRTHDLVRATGPSEPTVADDLADLLAAIDVDADRARETVAAFNDACDPDGFDPHVLDGNDTDPSLRPPKSNWALPIDDPPFYAYAVTGGITFAFGGVEITPDAEVVDDRGHLVSGLYAAGNSTGGLFHDNYPGGTGLTNAAVFGKLAAERADEYLG
jgi:tricarballylate dehydrogenase